MKYVRTKDRETGLAIILESEHYYHNELCYCGAESQADTIEELCDEFVWMNTIVEKDTIERIKKNGSDYPVYGAIWTDKGLIYVAKMNDKGELELL